MNTNIPVLKLELEGIKSSVASMLARNNEEINAMIIKSLDKQLTEDWIQSSIDSAVRECLEQSIKRVASNWELQQAITTLIGSAIAGMITPKKSENEK